MKKFSKDKKGKVFKTVQKEVDVSGLELRKKMLEQELEKINEQLKEINSL